jgi:hypothetical protein
LFPPPPPSAPGKARDLLGASLATTVYSCDGGSYFIAADSPSVLDDLVLTVAGNGQAWKIITFGVNLTTGDRSSKFLVRYRGFETYVGGLGPGVMAFDDEFMDFGFYLNRNIFPAGDSTFLVTGDLTLNPIAIVPNQTCYLAQQFREPHPGGPSQEDGEGPFTDVWNVFSTGPQVGTSEDLFWYDSPADGIYDETEPDNFGEEAPPGSGNFAFTVVVGSGTTTTVNPFQYQWVRGVYQSGSVGSLWFLDANYNIAKAGLVLFPNEPPAQIVVDSFAPTNAPTSIRLDVWAKVNTAGLSMKIEFWNFSTNQWAQVASSSVGTTDTFLVGFAQNPTLFVSPVDGSLKAKVSFYRTGLTLVWPWTVSVNQIRWTITDS